MSNALIEGRIRQIQDQAAARRIKREKASTELAERSRKSQEFDAARDAERQSLSPNDVTAMARMKAVTDGYAQQHQQQQEQENAERDKRDVRDLEALRQEFFDPETTPFRRGMLLHYAAEIHSRLNKAPMSAEQIYELWLRRSQQEKREEVRRRLQTVGESS